MYDVQNVETTFVQHLLGSSESARSEFGARATSGSQEATTSTSGIRRHASSWIRPSQPHPAIPIRSFRSVMTMQLRRTHDGESPKGYSAGLPHFEQVTQSSRSQTPCSRPDRNRSSVGSSGRERTHINAVVRHQAGQLDVYIRADARCDDAFCIEGRTSSVAEHNPQTGEFPCRHNVQRRQRERHTAPVWTITARSCSRAAPKNNSLRPEIGFNG